MGDPDVWGRGKRNVLNAGSDFGAGADSLTGSLQRLSLTVQLLPPQLPVMTSAFWPRASHQLIDFNGCTKMFPQSPVSIPKPAIHLGSSSRVS